MNALLNELHSLIERHKLYENSIIFNGVDSPYFDLDKSRSIYFSELIDRVFIKIQQINEQIEIAEEENDQELIQRLIMQRKKVRNLLEMERFPINSIDDLQFPRELDIDQAAFSII